MNDFGQNLVQRFAHCWDHKLAACQVGQSMWKYKEMVANIYTGLCLEKIIIGKSSSCFGLFCTARNSLSVEGDGPMTVCPAVARSISNGEFQITDCQLRHTIYYTKSKFFRRYVDITCMVPSVIGRISVG